MGLVLLGASVLVLYATPVGQGLLLRGMGLFAGVRPAPARFALPRPTGPLAVGTTQVHLVDPTRWDPWSGGDPRELMVTLWYPTVDTLGHTLAPYMTRRAAEYFEETSLHSVGLRPEDVDAAGVRTHAWEGAVPEARGEPRPVLLFSPGGSQLRAFGTSLLEELASHGYIAISLDHTHEAPVVEFPDGRLAVAAVESGKSTLRQLISVRVQDIRFLLDELGRLESLGGGGGDPDPWPVGLREMMDVSRVGIIGHSAGGFSAAQAMYEDGRLDAGVNLDGSLGFSIADGDWGEVTRAGLDRPFMLVGAGFSGADRLPHTHLHAPDWKSIWERSTGWKLDLYFPEGEHFTFTDYQVFLPQLHEKLGLPRWLLLGMIGTVDPGRAVDSQRAYVKAFFDQHLRGVRQPLLEGPSPAHPDVDFISEGG